MGTHLRVRIDDDLLTAIEERVGPERTKSAVIREALRAGLMGMNPPVIGQPPEEKTPVPKAHAVAPTVYPTRFKPTDSNWKQTTSRAAHAVGCGCGLCAK